MPPTTSSDILVTHSDGPLRQMLGLALADAGYRVTATATFSAALCLLHAARTSLVVVAGNWTHCCYAEVAFFRHIASKEALARRHHFVFLAICAEDVPDDLEATLRGLDVPILPMPIRLSDLLEAVAHAARRDCTRRPRTH